MNDSLAYRCGYRDYRTGLSIRQCPYLDSSTEARDWRLGWWHAQDDEDDANEDYD